MTTPPPFEMTVDLNVLEHLGINLYSNIAAVITEVVANAWDADAGNVSIQFISLGDKIVIVDDGIGMTQADLNEKYLRVGYRRRDEDPTVGRVTAKGRPVMGRKGLGKLSLFSIANTIEVQSFKDGAAQGFTMTVEGIKAAVKAKTAYNPEPMTADKLTVTSGTTITLRDIKRQRLGKGAIALTKRLARRFSVIGEARGFKITVDGNHITAADRGDLPKAQFLWSFQGTPLDANDTKHVLEREELECTLEGWDPKWHVTGWLATARLPKDLDSEEAGNLNGIVAFARGRLFHENVLEKLNDGRLFTKYLTGQIEADFLDDDEEPDIATSDRQRVQEDDPRYVGLIAFLKNSLNKIEKRWSEWRRKHEVKKAQETSPALKEWLDSLAPGFRASAETLISRLSALPVDDEEDRRLLYRHGIYAFERMKLRGSTEMLATNIDDVDVLLKVLADQDSLEASLYRDIVKSRLEVIKEFQTLVDADAKEKVLQKYLFSHLWLLDSSWERATGSELMEKRLTEDGVVVADLTKKEKLGRVDIKYRTCAGKHLIIELKKAGRKVDLMELQAQGILYVDKLKKILRAQDVAAGVQPVIYNIEVIFVLGTLVDEEETNPSRLKSCMDAISPGSRIVHYDTLIKGAQEAYSQYIDATKEIDKLEKIANNI